jgi:hypothetical protein
MCNEIKIYRIFRYGCNLIHGFELHYIIMISISGTSTKTFRQCNYSANVLLSSNTKPMKTLQLDLASTVAAQFCNNASHPIYVGDAIR